MVRTSLRVALEMITSPASIHPATVLEISGAIWFTELVRFLYVQEIEMTTRGEI